MAHELKRKLDYSDLEATPDDGRRYELVHGDLLVTPSPTPVHQRVVGRLFRILDDYFRAGPTGEVFVSPVDVILTSHDVFVPDLIVVAQPEQVTTRGIEGPPLLVVEILSPSTRSADRGIKARRYAELGVEHYWIIDPEVRRLDCYEGVEGTLRLVASGREDETLAPPDFEGLAIPLTSLWA